MTKMFVQSLVLFLSACLLLLSGAEGKQSTPVPGSLRLVAKGDDDGGSPSTGFLQVYYNGEWGRVCGSGGSFGEEEANVACRQLGFGNPIGYTTINSDLAVLGLTAGRFKGQLPNWLDRLRCSGSESHLEQCRTQDIGSPSLGCTLNDYVALSCVGDAERALAGGLIAAIVIGVLVPVGIIVLVVIIAITCICCAGCWVGCLAGRRSNRPQDVSVDVTTAPPASYSQTSSQQALVGYGPYSGGSVTIAPPQAVALQEVSYQSPGVKPSPAGGHVQPELKQYPIVEVPDPAYPPGSQPGVAAPPYTYS